MENETENKLTRQQQKSIHKLFGQISEYCIGKGLDQRTVVNKLETYSCPTSPQFVKETWRAMQVSITGKTSTTELTRKEIDQVYDVFNKFWSELTGEHFAFPSIQDLLLMQHDV
jgi:hypothetical protein